MQCRILSQLLAGAVVAGAAPALGAQGAAYDGKARGSYFAVSSTPLGALPAQLPLQFVGAVRRGVALRAQYGFSSAVDTYARRALGLGIDFTIGRSALGLTAGYVDYQCDPPDAGGVRIDSECAGAVMLGANVTTRVTPLPRAADRTARLAAGVDVVLGYSSGGIEDFTMSAGSQYVNGKSTASNASVALGLPVAVTVGVGPVTLVPHVVPHVAYGRSSLSVAADGSLAQGDFNDTFDETDRGLRYVLGGGVGVLVGRSGLALDLGFRRIFVSGADVDPLYASGKTSVGVGLTYAPR